MDDDFLNELLLLLGVLILIAGAVWALNAERKKMMRRRIAKVKNRSQPVIQKDAVEKISLRRSTRSNPVPLLGALLSNFSITTRIQERLGRSGLSTTADMYILICAGIMLISGSLIYMLKNSLSLAIVVSLFAGIILPYFIVGLQGTRRMKKFLKLFPDAIDFIVRGLRSGLPVTESLNIIGLEMEEPIKGVFMSIGESIKLGVSFEKSLHDMAKKLSLAEFNFFVTSIILQRETGGNLSEILNNLSDVLRKRIMMHLKIKAMSSEAKASAIIIGSLPFFVMGALAFISPAYIDPLFHDTRGNIALGFAGFMLFLGMGIMFKMSRFEI